MYNIKLTKIIGGKNLRTNEVIGSTRALPKKDRNFSMISESLIPELDYRLVVTSRIVSLEQIENNYVFITETGSKYQVEILSEIEETQ